MTTKRVALLSDIPKEGYFNKRTQALCSPSESEIESHIACADPQYVSELQKDIVNILAASKSKLRGRSITSRATLYPSGDRQQKKSLKDMTPEELQEAMLGTSRDLYGAHAMPLDLLPLLRGYDPSLLTDQEFDHVRSTTASGGDEQGAIAMYDLMQKYEQWLPCTVDVLRDAHVNMKEFAELLNLRVGLERAVNEILENPENAERIAMLLKSKLRMHLKPLEILHLFHKYDPNVLVQDDIDAVAELTIQEGNEIGTDELLDRLIQYPGWYPCLLLVLKDSSVGLGYLADELANLIAEEFQEIKELQDHAQEELLARLARLKERAKEGKKKKKKPKTTKLEKVELSESPSDLTSRDPRGKLKKGKAWKKMMAGKHGSRYPGLDWNCGLAPHALDHLPTDIETANQAAQFIENAKKDEFVLAPGQHERMLDPWTQGEKYAEKYALTELFTFMLTRLILDTPRRPVDYLIDLTREINRLDRARHQVDQLAEGKKKCEMEAAQGKSLPESNELQEKSSVVTQNEETEQENEEAKHSETALPTDYTEENEITDEPEYFETAESEKSAEN